MKKSMFPNKMLILGETIHSDFVYLFSHGIADTYKQVHHYRHNSIVLNPCITFNYPDATEKFWRTNFWKTSLGQTDEIRSLAQVYTKTLEMFPSKKIILCGISRGAATIFNFIALQKPNHCAAVILESPYDSMSSVVSFILYRMGMLRVPGMYQIGQQLLSGLFHKFNWNKEHPIHNTDLFPKNTPILFICSLSDLLVPFESTVHLYSRLIKSGHNKCHLVVFPFEKHGKIVNGTCKKQYQYAVHAFYKKYNLPHNTLFAQKGAHYID